MKKACKWFAVILLAFACLLAFTSCDSGDNYEFSDGTLIYREAEGGYEVIGVEDENAHDIEIPSVVNWKSVVSIGSYAFNGNANVYTIKIPSSVKTIKDYAIADCCNLLTVSLPNGIERVGESNFTYCPNLEYESYENGKYVGNSYNPYLVLFEAVDSDIIDCKVNSKCKIIGSAFKWCEELESVEIPSGVKVIDKYAFGVCSSLKEIEIPSSVKIIGESAFTNCVALENIEMSERLEKIEGGAFYNCRSLTNISLPNTLKKIDSSLFGDCDKLVYNEYEGGLYLGNERNPYFLLVRLEDPEISKLTIHKDTKLIDMYYAFAYYGFDEDFLVAEFSVPENSKYFKSIDGNLYSKDGKTLVRYAVGKEEESFSVPEGVEEIFEYAFYSSTLKSIYLPDSVKKLGESAFSLSAELEAINIPSKVEEIPRYAFGICSSLKSVELPEGLVSIGQAAFIHCTSLEGIDFPQSLRVIENDAFSSCDSLTSLTIPDNVCEIGYSVFDNCDNLESVVLGRGITHINNYSFWMCKSLKTVEFGNNITKIEAGAFSECEALEEIVFNGTAEEWISIEKHTDNTNGSRWNINTGKYTVICTDGRLDKSDNKTTG